MKTDSTARRIHTALGAALVATGAAAGMVVAPGTAAALPEPADSAHSVASGLPTTLTSLLEQLGFGSLGSTSGSLGSSSGSLGSSSGSLGSTDTGSFGSSYGSVVDGPGS